MATADTDRLSISLLTREYPPSIYGGAGVHVAQLVPQLRKLIDVDLPDGTFLNLNFPNCAPKDVQGVSVTGQGKLDFGLTIDAREDGRAF